jgi:hypothetical protein
MQTIIDMVRHEILFEYTQTFKKNSKQASGDHWMPLQVDKWELDDSI